jgi:hypothetical protein
MSQFRAHGSLGRLDDVRLATLVRGGDAAAFEALYDRHHANEVNMEKKEATLRTIAVRKPGPVRLTRAAVPSYGCCCCVRIV